MIHDDDRRTLFDYANGDFKSAKAIVVKKDDVVIGDHKHVKKDEQFLLLMGTITEMIVGDKISYNVKGPYPVFVKRGIYHKFICEKGVILLCAATELFDEKDDYK